MHVELSSLNKNNRPVGLAVLLPPGHHPVRAAKFRTSLVQRHRESGAATTQEETGSTAGAQRVKSPLAEAQTQELLAHFV